MGETAQNKNAEEMAPADRQATHARPISVILIEELSMSLSHEHVRLTSDLTLKERVVSAEPDDVIKIHTLRACDGERRVPRASAAATRPRLHLGPLQ